MPALFAPLHSPFIRQIDLGVLYGRLDKKTCSGCVPTVASFAPDLTLLKGE
jgi:hypothetical protein